jgi:cell wall-associated NlpC family hydrolase
VAGSRSARGLDNAAAAAGALQAQALASRAARAKDFPADATVVATIAIATRALIAKAAKAGAAPRDETDVMGAAPDLGGTVAYKGRTGDGPSIALTPFDGRIATANWPNKGVGTKVRGTAPFLPADGVNVHPRLPAYAKKAKPLRAQLAVDSALEQLGSPYVWDAAGADTFDCSGLTLWAWGHAGVELEHYTGKQVLQGVQVNPGQLLPGDLLLFGKDLHHVGMYLGSGYMIDAPSTGDYVKIQLVSDMGDFTVAVRP